MRPAPAAARFFVGTQAAQLGMPEAAASSERPARSARASIRVRRLLLLRPEPSRLDRHRGRWWRRATRRFAPR